ncbi:hypothetical protein BH09MYX1_BH09MYX1_57200 [soil metagenome]
MTTPHVTAALLGTWANDAATLTFANDGSFTYTTTTYLWASVQTHVYIAVEKRGFTITDGARSVKCSFGDGRMIWPLYAIVTTNIGLRLSSRQQLVIAGTFLPDPSEGATSIAAGAARRSAREA